jgi:hypothetical protein
VSETYEVSLTVSETRQPRYAISEALCLRQGEVTGIYFRRAAIYAISEASYLGPTGYNFKQKSIVFAMPSRRLRIWDTHSSGLRNNKHRRF